MSSRKKILHLAGIVPIAAPKLDFQMPWNDSLIPVGPNYLAAERAVYECALAGCESIWVVCHKGTEPLLRKRLGDYISDPVSLTTGLNCSLRRRDISIYYIPIHPRDKERRDSLSWSILYGADNAYRISLFISKWIIPRKFYCAFPYGITPDKSVWKNRKIISSTDKTLFTFNNKSIKDGLHISFTFDEADYKTARDIIRQRELNTFNFQKRENAQEYTLQEVFCNLKVNKKECIELPWHYDISNWKNYKQFLASDHSNELVKNEKCFLKMKRQKFIDPHLEDDRYKIDREITAPDPIIPDNLENL